MAYNRLFDATRPMGSWTGLPLAAGAPLSGALWGAGAGLTIQAVRKIMEEDDRKRRRMGWRAPLLVGTGAGAGVGLFSLWNRALAEKEKGGSVIGSDMERAVRLIRRDPAISDAEAGSIIQALHVAPYSQKQRVFAALGTGALTGAAASRILGLGRLGTAVAAGAGAWLAHQYTRPPQYLL
jgi:hypothetical protein